MDAIQGLSIGFPPLGLFTTQAISPLAGSPAAASSNLLADLFGQGSAIVNLSGVGQLLSTADTFQSRLANFRPGTVDSGIGQNFGDDLASFAAEAQYLVDTVNNAQSGLSNLAGLGSQAGGLAATFALALNRTSGQAFANGDSSLKQLAQIGISFQAGGSLAIDLTKLKSAFASDQTGAFSLLSTAGDAFRDLATTTIAQAQGSYSATSALSQFELANQLFGSSGLLANGNGFNLASALFLESFGGGINGTTSSVQNLLALNEFNLVSTLL